MDLTLFWALFAILCITSFAIALAASEQVDSDEDYFLAKRSVGKIALIFTLLGTQLGAGMLLGTAHEAYRFGLFGLLYNVGIVLGMCLLGLGFAGKWRTQGIKTTAQIFEKNYHSVFLRRAASVLSVLTLGGILVGQIVASRKLLTFAIGGHDWILAAFWIITFFFTMIGGLKAVIATHIFQVSFIVLFMMGAIAASLFWIDPAFFSFMRIENIESIHLAFEEYPSGTHAYLLTPLLFALFEQDLAQRFFASRNKSTATLGALFAALLLLLISAFPALMGMKARLLGLEADESHNALLVLAKFLAPPFVFYLALCAFIAAISSTANAVLNAIGSNVVFDFPWEPFVPANKLRPKLSARSITLVIGLSALFLAFFFDDALYVLLQSYELSVSCLFIPVVFAFFVKRLYPESAFGAFLAGLFGFFLFRLYAPPVPRELCSLSLSLLAFGAGHFLGRRRSLVENNRKMSK